MKRIKKFKRIHEDRTDWFIPAGMFIGLGVGLITNQIPGCLLIGFGAGFLISAIISICRKKKK